MKLYLEKDIYQSIADARYFVEQIMPSKIIVQKIKPIELPIDEEIKQKAFGHSDWHCDQSSFIYGAKYVIYKIKGGNK